MKRELGIDIEWLRQVFFAQFWTEIVEGRLDLLPTLQACLDQSLISTSALELTAYWFHQDSRIDMDVLSEISALKRGGLAVFLATNQDHLRAQYLMREMGLRRHVDGIIYSAELGARKPSLTFYQLAKNVVDYPMESIVFVDDTVENVLAARDAGMHALQWKSDDSLLKMLRSATFL